MDDCVDEQIDPVGVSEDELDTEEFEAETGDGFPLWASAPRRTTFSKNRFKTIPLLNPSQ